MQSCLVEDLCWRNYYFTVYLVEKERMYPFLVAPCQAEHRHSLVGDCIREEL